MKMFTICVILLTVEEHLMMHHGISVVSQGHRHHMACKDLLPLIYCQYMSTVSKKYIISKGLNIIIQSVQSNFTKIISKCKISHAILSETVPESFQNNAIAAVILEFYHWNIWTITIKIKFGIKLT